jgi:hypothetical protein
LRPGMARRRQPSLGRARATDQPKPALDTGSTRHDSFSCS